MRSFSCYLALILLLPQCGGGTASSANPRSAADDAEGSSDTSATAGSSRGEGDAEESASDAPSTRETSKGPDCDDGTCSKCGSGICLAGWYCDEKANGGGACSWLAECADKPTCACVTRVLGKSCKCHEESGALKVACD
jgi:hypothetical protein